LRRDFAFTVFSERDSRVESERYSRAFFEIIRTTKIIKIKGVETTKKAKRHKCIR